MLNSSKIRDSAGEPLLLAQLKQCDAAAVLFGLKFADNIHYKFKSSQASKAMLQSSKHTGTKKDLTQNSDSRTFKVTCFESVERR